MHFDLRPDNTLINGSDEGVVLDWNWTRPGPAWVDTVMLLNTAFGRLDIDAALTAHPSTASVSPEHVDAVLAALGGNQLEASNRPPVPASPMLRAHQRQQGLRALGWLAQRRAWAEP